MKNLWFSDVKFTHTSAQGAAVEPKDFSRTVFFTDFRKWGLGHPKYLIIYKKSVQNERVKKVLDPVLASVAEIIVCNRGPIPIAK